jgi:hypothetical protein
MRLLPTRYRLALPLAALLVLPMQISAQETQLFTWNGRVDRQVRLTMQGSNTSSSAVRGNEYSGRFRVGSALPPEEGTVRVVTSGGRGDVSVIQQPSASNNFSTVIRVVDRNSGADRYQVTAYFTPTNAGRYGRGRGNSTDPRRAGQAAVLHWSGMVDSNAEVRWQGANVGQRALDGNPLRSVRSSISGNANTGNNRNNNVGQATVAVTEGRGQVDVVQQPSPANGNTTIVRITDPQGGYGRYAFDVTRQ